MTRQIGRKMPAVIILLVALLVVTPLVGTTVFAAADRPESLNDETPGDREDEVNYYCENIEARHPVAQYLADTYDLAYDQVMTWFCDGHSFGHIALALKTQERSGEDAGLLLEQLSEEIGWGNIWKEMGLIGRSEDGDPAEGVGGPPEHAGPPEGVGGPPEHAGPPEGIGGPPEHAGPPEGVGGPPEHAGPPEGVGGPPEHAGPPEGVGRP